MEEKQLNIHMLENWGLFSEVKRPLLIAGPCSVESEEQVFQTAKALKAGGVELLRAGLWKPRTHPNSFEGVGHIGIPWLQRIQRELGMKIATEVANTQHVEEALKAGIDLLWIGARTTTNPFAVQEIAEALRGTDVPVLVKNPVNPDVELWAGALKRLNLVGLKKIGAIHRGFSTFGKSKYRNLPQWQLPIEMKRRYPDLLMICDPSHIAGRRDSIFEVAQKSMDLGFSGLFIESHISPDQALSDAAQQITPTTLFQLLKKLVIRVGDSEDMAYKASIDDLRAQIDVIDQDLLDILAKRMEISAEIGHYKKANNITILQAGRWDNLLAQVLKKGEERGLQREFLEKIFNAIHQASIDRQTDVMNE
jgi:chorismate mutase